jgi:23S rRNA G2445 N2-methylase RlmL
VLADGHAAELADVYEFTRAVEWADHLPDPDFGVVGARHGHHEFTSVDVADRVGQADARVATLDADLVVTNLPFGIRVAEDLRGRYTALPIGFARARSTAWWR